MPIHKSNLIHPKRKKQKRKRQQCSIEDEKTSDEMKEEAYNICLLYVLSRMQKQDTNKSGRGKSINRPTAQYTILKYYDKCKYRA